MSINQATISGRVGKKPELKKTASGVSWVKFSVATEEKWKDKKTGEDMKRTDWLTVKAWRKLAEVICQYVVQGQYVEVIGAVRCDVVEKDGKTNYYNYIQAEKVEFREKPKAWWDAYNAQKAAGTLPPKNTPAPKAPAEADKLTILLAQMKTMQDTIALLTSNGGIPVGVPPTDDDAGFIPPDEEDYSAQPHDAAPPAPQSEQKQLISTL
jgi:single-strand DNA-binding protein